MTKEEIIKKAYGHLYETHSHLIDSNGWVHNGNIDDYLTMGETEFLGECEYSRDTLFRPMLLKGIENNNGWTKIESEEDLPKETIEYWVVLESGTITKASYLDGRKVFFMFGDLKVTHYKKLNYPQPPIY